MVRKSVINNNLLQARTVSSSKRINYEIILRLSFLSDELHRLLLNSSYPDQLIILWISICQAYDFIHEFATEIIREKFLRMDFILNKNDFISFYNRKADWNEELDKYSDQTKDKHRTVIFKILREAGIIDKSNHIIRVMPSSELIKALYAHDPNNLTVLPMSDIDIKELLQC